MRLALRCFVKCARWPPRDQRVAHTNFAINDVSQPVTSFAAAVCLRCFLASHAFLGTPRFTAPRAWPGAHRKPIQPGAVARPTPDLIAIARPRWHRVRWHIALHARERTADCAAIRVTPAIHQRHPRLPPEIWLVVERDIDARLRIRFYYLNLPATASLSADHQIRPSALADRAALSRFEV